MINNIASSLLQSLSIQRRVIGALLLREIITRFGRHNIGVLWLILEPMLFTLGIAGLWYIGRLHTYSDIPVIAFAITGYSSILAWRNTANRCLKAIEPNLALMYHRNVKVIDVFIARTIIELTGATASFIVLTIFFGSIGIMHWPHDLIRVLEGWLLIAWFSFALGFVIGSISERSEMFERVWHIITYLLFPLSGALYMVHWLPDRIQKIMLWLPMVHGVESIRHGFFGDIIPTYENYAYFSFVNLILTLIGLALVKECGRRVQPQ